MSTAKKIHHYRSYDPTGTTTLRDRFAGKMGARFRELARAVREAVEDDDVFALKPNPTRTLAVFQSPGKRAYQFQTDAQKITSFNEWLDLQVREKIYNFRRGDLRPISGRTLRREQWTDYYIGSAYQDGIRDGSKNIHKLGTDVAKGPITDVFNAPVHQQRVENLYTRTFEQLKGVTADMSRDISTVLSDGLIQGRNAKDVGRALNKVITGKGGTLELTDSLGRRVPSMTRAKMIARTEIVRAHHMGNIQQIRSFGFDNVLIKAELLTAGDHRVCPECLALEARGPMPLDEAEKLIPVHPLCRCIVIPTRIQPKKPLRQAQTIEPAQVPSVKIPAKVKRDLDEAVRLVKSREKQVADAIKAVDDAGDVTQVERFVLTNHLKRQRMFLKMEQQELDEFIRAAKVNRADFLKQSGVKLFDEVPKDVTEAVAEAVAPKVVPTKPPKPPDSLTKGVFDSNLSDDVMRKRLEQSLEISYDDYNLLMRELPDYLDEISKGTQDYIETQLYQDLLPAMRKGKLTTSQRKIVKDIVKDMKETQQDYVVFRGSTDYTTIKSGKLDIGDVFEDKAFTSTTANPKVALQYASDIDGGIGGELAFHRNSAIFEIRIPKGSRAAMTGREEAQVILPPGTKYRVVDVRKNLKFTEEFTDEALGQRLAMDHSMRRTYVLEVVDDAEYHRLKGCLRAGLTVNMTQEWSDVMLVVNAFCELDVPKTPHKDSVFDTRLSDDDVRTRINKAVSKAYDDYSLGLKQSVDYLETISDGTRQYIGSSLYEELLPAMRSGIALTAKHKKVVKEMLKDIKPTNRDYVAFRGVRDFNKIDGGKLDVGSVFSDGAFTSVTVNPRIAFGYADIRKVGDDFLGLSDDSALFEIRIPKGAQASVVGRFESQIILRPNTKYRVTGVRKNFAFDDGFKIKRIYQVEIIDDVTLSAIKTKPVAKKVIPKGVTKSQQARNSISELIEEGKYTRKEIVAKIEDDFGDAISRSTIDDQFLKIRDAAVAKKRFGKAVDVDSKTGVLKFT